MRVVMSVAALVVALSATAASATKITIVTPYLAQPGTQNYVEAFQAVAERGLDVKSSIPRATCRGISRIEDAVNQKVDAIVINVDPAQVHAGLQTANEAGMPVWAWMRARPAARRQRHFERLCDGGGNRLYVVNRIRGKGGVVMFVFDAFPPVEVRGVMADAIFKNKPDIKVSAG